MVDTYEHTFEAEIQDRWLLIRMRHAVILGSSQAAQETLVRGGREISIRHEARVVGAGSYAAMNYVRERERARGLPNTHLVVLPELSEVLVREDV